MTWLLLTMLGATAGAAGALTALLAHHARRMDRIDRRLTVLTIRMDQRTGFSANAGRSAADIRSRSINSLAKGTDA